MFSYLFIVFLISVGTFVRAENNLSLSPAGLSLENDILSAPGGVVKLEKPLRLYSYFNAALTQQGELWPTYQNVKYRYGLSGQTQFDLSYSAGQFWNQNNKVTQLVNGGPGLYLAIDPSISAKYGHSFYVINFPVGTSYIDVSDPTWKNVSKIKLSKNTLDLLVKEDFLKKSNVSKYGYQNGYFTRLAMQFIAEEGNEKMRDLISKIFQRNKISLVQYSWERSKTKLICKQNSSSAFVYIGFHPESDLTVQVVRAKIDPEVIQNSVFGSQYSVSERSESEHLVLDDTAALKNALDTNSTKSLSSEQLSRIKPVTFNCN